MPLFDCFYFSFQCKGECGVLGTQVALFSCSNGQSASTCGGAQPPLKKRVCLVSCAEKENARQEVEDFAVTDETQHPSANYSINLQNEVSSVTDEDSSSNCSSNGEASREKNSQPTTNPSTTIGNGLETNKFYSSPHRQNYSKLFGKHPRSSSFKHHHHHSSYFTSSHFQTHHQRWGSKAPSSVTCKKDVSKMCQMSSLRRLCKMAGFRKLCCITCSQFS